MDRIIGMRLGRVRLRRPRPRQLTTGHGPRESTARTRASPEAADLHRDPRGPKGPRTPPWPPSPARPRPASGPFFPPRPDRGNRGRRIHRRSIRRDLKTPDPGGPRHPPPSRAPPSPKPHCHRAVQHRRARRRERPGPHDRQPCLADYVSEAPRRRAGQRSSTPGRLQRRDPGPARGHPSTWRGSGASVLMAAGGAFYTQNPDVR